MNKENIFQCTKISIQGIAILVYINEGIAKNVELLLQLWNKNALIALKVMIF